MTTELPTPPVTTTLCRGCDLAFCEDHRYLLDSVATHGSHHVIDPESPVTICCVCEGILRVDMVSP